MARAGACVAEIHQAVREAAEPGVTLLELEDIGAKVIAAHGCTKMRCSSSKERKYLGT